MDFHINDILTNLKSNNELPEGFDFLKKYDKNNNSIFEENEIEDIKQALIESAAKDDEKDMLSEEEMLTFYNKSYEKGKQASETNIWSTSFNLVNNWIESLIFGKSDLVEKAKASDSYKNLSAIKQEYVELYLNNMMRTGAIDSNSWSIDQIINLLIRNIETKQMLLA